MSELLYADYLATDPNDWQWVREAPEAWRIENGALHVRTLPGTLWGKTNSARNILLSPLQPAQPGLSSEVRVTNAPQQHGEQSGLIWYADDANYIKLIKESLDNSTWIVMAREEVDNPALVNKIPFSEATAHLRLRLAGDQMIGEVETAAGWLLVGSCAPLPHTSVHPGVYSHGAPEDTERWSVLTQFRVVIQ